MRKFFKSLDVDKENYGLLANIYFALFTSGVMTVMISTIMPYLREQNMLTYSDTGLLFSAHQLGTLITVMSVGVLPYIIGRKKTALILGFGMVAGLSLITVFKGPILLSIAYTLTGVGRGTMTNMCNVVAADVSGNKTGALNLLHAVFSAGALLSPIIVLLFTGALGLSYKYALIFAALLSFSALALTAFSRLDNEPIKKDRGQSLAIFKDRVFWLNTMILFFYICAEASIMGWFVTYFEDTGILSPAAAKITPTLLWLMMMTGRIICFLLSTKVDSNRMLMALALSFTLSFGMVLAVRSAFFSMVALALIGASMAGIYPTTLSAMRKSMTTLSTGVMIAIASLGGIIMPGIIGIVADNYGLFGAIATLLVALVAMVILTFIKLISAKAGKFAPNI